MLRNARARLCSTFTCQNRVGRLEGLILIGRGLAKRRALFREFPTPGAPVFLRLGLLEDGAVLYSAAQCRGFLRCEDSILLVEDSVLRSMRWVLYYNGATSGTSVSSYDAQLSFFL